MIRMLAVLLLLASGARAADLYVDSATGLASGTGTAARPFLTLWQAGLAVRPCDVVHVAGTFASHAVQHVRGTAACPITFLGWSRPGSTRAHLVAAAPGVSAVRLFDVQYVTLAGFDVSGLRGAEICIQLSSADYPDEPSHHVVIRDNLAHDCGGDGILAFQADHTQIVRNDVYRNASYTANGVFPSGISILASFDVDKSAGIKMVIDSNRLWQNSNVHAPCPATDYACMGRDRDTDGNGIIVDTGCANYVYPWGVSPGKRQRCYRGRTQISNNVVTRSGGRCIHLWMTSHVDIISNTCVLNNADPFQTLYRAGEVSICRSGDVGVFNNVFVTDGLPAANVSPDPKSAIQVWEGSGTMPAYLNPFTPGDGAGPIRIINNWTWSDSHASYRPDLPVNYIDARTAGIEMHDNFYGIPYLVDRAGLDWTANLRPRPDSPLLGRSRLDLSPLATDRLGASRRPTSAIGAYAR